MSTYDNMLKNIRASGKCSFTIQEAVNMTGKKPEHIISAMYRQRKEGNIVNPVKGLYVIVPPEYRFIGCLPEHILIPLIMDYWKQDYYVCLLSAAEFYSASHQKPQLYQVMLNKQMQNIHCGKVRIQFIYKKSLSDLEHIISKTVDTGYLKISSPEVTAMDLFNYTNKAGGINHVATVISELIEAIDIDKLISLAYKHNAKSWIQRFGYILENIDPIDNDKQAAIIQALQEYLSKMDTVYIALTPDMPSVGFAYNKKWKIIENTTVESDI